MVNNDLLGGAMCPSWKNMKDFVNGFRMTSHPNDMENNPVMFETTNQ